MRTFMSQAITGLVMIQSLIRKFMYLVERGRFTFIAFGMVGSMGVIINISSFSACRFGLGLELNLSAFIAYSIAVTNNYVLNHLWTFSSRTQGHSLALSMYGQYYLGNIIGLLANLLVLNLLVSIFGSIWEIYFQILAILFGTCFNFLIARHLVFKKKKLERV